MDVSKKRDRIKWAYAENFEMEFWIFVFLSGNLNFKFLLEYFSTFSLKKFQNELIITPTYPKYTHSLSTNKKKTCKKVIGLICSWWCSCKNVNNEISQNINTSHISNSIQYKFSSSFSHSLSNWVETSEDEIGIMSRAYCLQIAF